MLCRIWQSPTSPLFEMAGGGLPTLPQPRAYNLFFFVSPKHSGLRALKLHILKVARMKKSPTVENIVVDEAHQRTYVVMACRTLTDGELFRAIRVALLKRGEKLEQGGRLVIDASNVV